MGMVHIDNLAEGMLLAVDTHDRNGRLLLAQGTELTNSHIRMFLTWGISQVDILDHEDPLDQTAAGDNIDPEVMHKAVEELKQQFSNNDLTHPAIAELFQQCLIRTVRNDNR